MRILLRFVLLTGLVWSLSAALVAVATGHFFTFLPPTERERAWALWADDALMVLVRPLGLVQRALPPGALPGYGTLEQAITSGLWASGLTLLGMLRPRRRSAA